MPIRLLFTLSNRYSINKVFFFNKNDYIIKINLTQNIKTITFNKKKLTQNIKTITFNKKKLTQNIKTIT
jgi:hypothetical protein